MALQTSTMYRQCYFFNITTPSALPRLERWYWRHHAPETVRNLGPWITRYESWRCEPLSHSMAFAQAAPLGLYNYRYTELWFGHFELRGPPIELTWYEQQAADTGSQVEDAYNPGWGGKVEGPHPVAQAYVPGLPEVALFNHLPPHEAPACYRWTAIVKFPEGTEGGDQWFLEEVLKALQKVGGVVAVKSSKTLEVPTQVLQEMSPGEPVQMPWQRWVEVKFTDAETWVKDAPAALGWDENKKSFGHGIQPYRDLVSVTTLERPDWTLSDLRPYR